MNQPVRASYLISGLSREELFATLLDVRRFPEWGYGLERAEMRDDRGKLRDDEVRPGTHFDFTLSAAGLTHNVSSLLVVVEAPENLQWRYVKGAVGNGGWTLQQEGNAVRMTLFSDYEVKPGWLNRIAHSPPFRRLTEDLLRRSMRRFEQRLKGDPES